MRDSPLILLPKCEVIHCRFFALEIKTAHCLHQRDEHKRFSGGSNEEACIRAARNARCGERCWLRWRNGQRQSTTCGRDQGLNRRVPNEPISAANPCTWARSSPMCIAMRAEQMSSRISTNCNSHGLTARQRRGRNSGYSIYGPGDAAL